MSVSGFWIQCTMGRKGTRWAPERLSRCQPLYSRTPAEVTRPRLKWHVKKPEVHSLGSQKLGKKNVHERFLVGALVDMASSCVTTPQNELRPSTAIHAKKMVCIPGARGFRRKGSNAGTELFELRAIRFELRAQTSQGRNQIQILFSISAVQARWRCELYTGSSIHQES